MSFYSFKRKYLGDRRFYKKVLAVLLPITLQNAITTFVSMLDNVMVGRVGTEQMSGVSIANQLIYIFNLCIFGVMSSASIFGAQFYGNNDAEGHRDTMRIRLLLGFFVGAAAMAILYFFGPQLVGLYLQGEEGGVDSAAVMNFALDYIHVIIWGFIPFALANAYASAMRETSETFKPMVAGLAAVLLNLVFNYFLIFGTFGFPELGVKGAAIATNMSRFLELGLLIFWTHSKAERFRYIKGVYRGFKIRKGLLKPMLKKGSPLLLNETMYGFSIAFLSQCYSIRGVDVVAALNISSTLNNVCIMVFLSMGSAISIIVGQFLGAGKFNEAKEWARKMTVFSLMLSTITCLLMLLLSGIFPYAYNTTEEVRALASTFIIIYGLSAFTISFINCSYFTLRSGGRTFITFLFDSGFILAVCIPIAYCLGHFTNLRIEWIIAIVQLSDLIKCAVGYILVKKDVWVRKIVA